MARLMRIHLFLMMMVMVSQKLTMIAMTAIPTSAGSRRHCDGITTMQQPWNEQRAASVDAAVYHRWHTNGAKDVASWKNATMTIFVYEAEGEDLSQLKKTARCRKLIIPPYQNQPPNNYVDMTPYPAVLSVKSSVFMLSSKTKMATKLGL